jgi:hypothetical protein
VLKPALEELMCGKASTRTTPASAGMVFFSSSHRERERERERAQEQEVGGPPDGVRRPTSAFVHSHTGRKKIRAAIFEGVSSRIAKESGVFMSKCSSKAINPDWRLL